MCAGSGPVCGRRRLLARSASSAVGDLIGARAEPQETSSVHGLAPVSVAGLNLEILALARPEASPQRLSDLSAGRSQEPRRRQELDVHLGHLGPPGGRGLDRVPERDGVLSREFTYAVLLHARLKDWRAIAGADPARRAGRHRPG